MNKLNVIALLVFSSVASLGLAEKTTHDMSNSSNEIEYKNYQSTEAALKENVLYQVPDHNLKQSDTNRWYTQDQVESGKKLYKQTCIACHLEDAKGTANWQDSLDDGSYPPPPLNGTAHTWHHPLGQLHEVIKYGLIEYGTTMPAWKNVYNDEEILSLIASFQSYWSDEIYLNWIERNN